MTMKKLTEGLDDQLRKQTERAQEEHSRLRHLAELWDARMEAGGYGYCLQPWIMHTSKLFGSIGTYAFREATPEQAVELMTAFPPVPMAVVRTQMWTSFRPADYVDPRLGGGEQIKSKERVIEDVAMCLDRTTSGSHCKLQWWTMFGAELVGLDVELLSLFNVTPAMVAHVTYDRFDRRHISRITGACPEYAIKPAAPLSHVRYSAGAEHYFPHIVIYNNVPAYIEQLAGWCYSQRRASKKAYHEDKMAGLPPVSSDKAYDKQPLRAGTREQYECLQSEDARRDRALAEKHWKQYAEDYGIKSSQGYFDHYAWACEYLKRHVLYEVPDPRDPSKAYKYGHAWL